MSQPGLASNATIGLDVGVRLRSSGAFMKRVLLGVAVAALAGPALASEMTLPGPVQTYSRSSSPLLQPYDWSGFYFGARIDYSRAKTDSTTINTATGAVDAVLSATRSNFHEGGQVGFDYMTGSRFVFGILADAATGDDNISNLVNAAGNSLHSEEFKNVASGTVRGRIGYALYNALLYGTGGWAWSTGSIVRTQVIGKAGGATPGTIESGPGNLTGWTAGGGLAFGFWRNWEVFGEYRYTSYQSNNIVFPIAQRSLTTITAANLIEVGLNFKFNPIFARY
jgi:opacity protein-like surface antigen